jgi:hypothetical protein
MSRAFPLAGLKARKVYRGFDYRTSQLVAKTGAEWREDVELMRVERAGPDDPSCVHAFVNAELQVEIYLVG